jgi:hypothetical protein
MKDQKQASERVEIKVERDRATATLFLGGKYLTAATVVCVQGNWASGTEGVVMALTGLVRWIRKTRPPIVQIRDASIVNLGDLEKT